MKSSSNQKGSVLIIVLWTSALLTVLVTAMAGAVRLSAITVSNNQDASIGRLAIQSAVSHAEMELLLERMPRPIGEQLEETEEGEGREEEGFPIDIDCKSLAVPFASGSTF